MTDPRNENRRAHDRIKKHFSSSVRYTGGERSGAWMLVFVKNISAGGMLFNVEQPAAVGAALELRIDMLSGREPISCLGRVVRCKPIEGYPLYEVAVQFDRIDEPDRRYLDRLAELLRESRLKDGAAS